MKKIRTAKEVKLAIEVARDRKAFLIETLRLGMPNVTTTSVKMISNELIDITNKLRTDEELLRTILHFDSKILMLELEVIASRPKIS